MKKIFNLSLITLLAGFFAVSCDRNDEDEIQNVEFTLVDSIGKKITVVNAVDESLGLKNVKAYHERAEKIKDKFHFVVSRAVTQMPIFLRWLKGKFEKEQFNPKHNGVLYLKGGDLGEELAGIKCEIYHLKDQFEEEFFDTKKVVYLSKGNFNS